MKLKIKEEYKDYSFGGGRLGKIKLRNLDTSLYQYYYERGFSEYFEEVIENKTKKQNIDLENDTNK